MSGGYIKHFRSMWETEGLNSPVLCEHAAWMWLCSHAAWKDTETRIKGVRVEVRRGQFATSLRTLAEAWGWSVKRVRGFLDRGVSREMIGLEKGTQFTLITICNYEKYQGEAESEGTVRARSGHGEGTEKKKGRREEGKRNPPTPLEGEVQNAFDSYNDVAEELGLPVAHKLTPDRRRKIAARLRDHGIDDWRSAVAALRDSDHCQGKNDRGWKADLDFVCQPKSFNRLIEGGYASARASPKWKEAV